MATNLKYLPSELGSAYQLGIITIALNAGYDHFVSGIAVGVLFSSRRTQTNGNLTFHFPFATKSGSPTAIRALLFDGPVAGMDDDRPTTSAATASVDVDASGISAPGWLTFAFTNISLVAGKMYYLLVTNATTDQSTNNIALIARYAVGGSVVTSKLVSTTNGFTGDQTVNLTLPVYALKYNDGTLEGMPYSVATSSVSNSNLRGNRYLFDYDVTVAGMMIGQGNTVWGSNPGVAKLISGGSVLTSANLSHTHASNNFPVMFPESVTIPANTVFYLVIDPAATTNTMSGAIVAASVLPDDVSDMVAESDCVKWVFASDIANLEASATPGFTAIIPIFDEISGGSGGGETSHTFQL